MSRLKDIVEIRQAGEVGNRMVRVKSWEELSAKSRKVVMNEEGEITHIFAPDGFSTVQEFPRTIKHLCGEIVEIDQGGRVMTYFGKNRCTGGELYAASHFMLSPWMYDELEVPDPRADERLQHNIEHQRKKVEPRLGPCLSCGEIKLLDMEGAMGECMDCVRKGKDKQIKRNALKRQVGGNHYSKMAIQPAEFCLANMTVEELSGVLKWMVCKYTWRIKDSMREDWQKAKHYIEMIEEEMVRRMDG